MNNSNAQSILAVDEIPSKILKRAIACPTAFEQIEKRPKLREKNKVLEILTNCADGKSFLNWPKEKKLRNPQALANIIVRPLLIDSSTYVIKQ